MRDNEARIRALLSKVDEEFKGLNHYQRATFALEQISMWQQKFNEAKNRILKEYTVDATAASGMIGQCPEIEA